MDAGGGLLQLLLPAGFISRRGEEHIAMPRRVGAKTRQILFELLVAARVRGGKNLGRHHVRNDALDVPPAASAKRQTKAAGVGMKFDQPLDFRLVADNRRFTGRRISQNAARPAKRKVAIANGPVNFVGSRVGMRIDIPACKSG